VSLTHVRLRVRGRVQGVGFRFAACEAAATCAVVGWVRNLPDGSVEIVAQGTADAVARMTAWAHQGPRYASVDEVRVEPVEAVDDLEGFEIRR